MFKNKKKPPHGQTAKEVRFGQGFGALIGSFVKRPSFAHSMGRNFAAGAIGGALGYGAGGAVGYGVHKIREHEEHVRNKKLRDFIPVRRLKKKQH